MVVLREKRTNKPLAVSYTVEGLKWTLIGRGRYVYFANAIPKFNRNLDKFTWSGDTRLSNRLFVEEFEPRDHKDRELNKIERFFIRKAKHLNY